MTSDERSWSPDEVMSTLRTVSLFEGLPEDDLQRVAEIVRGAEVDEGEVLFEEGEPGDAYYVVVDGAVEILEESGGGEEKLAVRRSGQGFGEMALLNDASRSATARSVEPTRLLVVDREDFKLLLGGDSLAFRMMEILSTALRTLKVRFAAQQERARSGQSVREISRIHQRGLMARNAPKVEGYDIATGTSLEDDGEGRTVWDAFGLADGRTALVSLLVRGEGLPPAHQLGMARALLRVLAGDEDELTELTRRVNEGLAEAAVEEFDQHVECGILVPDGDTLLWTGAGRSPAAILRRDGNFEELPSHGPPLGMMGGFRYGVHRTSMGTGDVALVLSEASKGLFRGAADLVSTLHGKPVGEVVETVHRAIRKARDGEPAETTVIYAKKT